MRPLLLSSVLLLVPAAAEGQECAEPQADWIFCDDFESAADQTGALGLWDDQGLHPSNLVITTDPADVHSGQRALAIPAHVGLDTGGGPTKWFAGSDVVYVRFYVKFDPQYNYAHHFVTVIANRPEDMWSGFGLAGCRPSGSNFFSSGLEPWSNWGAIAPPGAWNFYSYSNDMSCDSGANCANYADPAAICDQCATRGSPCTGGLECCWGNSYTPATPQIPQLGTWSCLEMMLAANSGSASDGEQAMWVDGVEVGRFSGIRWRTDDTLKPDALALWHYVTDDNYRPGQTEQTVWFDDVVVSSSPIGCLAAPPPSDAGPTGADGATSGEDAGTPLEGDSGGCGCRAASRRDSGAGLGIAGAMIAVLFAVARGCRGKGRLTWR